MDPTGFEPAIPGFLLACCRLEGQCPIQTRLRIHVLGCIFSVYKFNAIFSFLNALLNRNTFKPLFFLRFRGGVAKSGKAVACSWIARCVEHFVQ